MRNSGASRISVISCLAILLAGAVATHASGEETSTVDALERARTLYQLALALEVDSTNMRAARDAYEAALEDPRLAQAATAGIDQTADRLENSDEMFRNVWPGVWQIRGGHEAYELYDSHVELALDRAWNRVVDQVVLRGFPRAPVYPRCEGDEEACGILRDMVLLSAHDHNRLREVTDDELRQHLGTNLGLGGLGERPRAAARERLLSALPERTLLIADIQVHPDISAPDPVSRVSVSLFRWDLDPERFGPIAFSEDVGVDVIPRWRHGGFLWVLLILVMVLAAMALGLWRNPGRSALASLVLTGVGVAYAMGAQEVVDAWLPAMDDLAWDPDGNPLFETWMWPVSQGLALAFGPTVIGFLALWQARPRASAYVDLEDLKLKLVTPPIMAGALLVNIDQLPILFGPAGALQCAGLCLGMLAPGAVLGWAGGALMEEGIPEVRQVVGALLAGVSGVVAFLLFTLGAAPVVVGGVGAAGAAVGWAVQRRRETAAAEVPLNVEGASAEAAVICGDLAHPEHVDRVDAPLATALDHHSAQEPVSLVVIRGESGAGKTRYAQELMALMKRQRTVQSVMAQAGAGSDAGGAAPYAVLSQLLRNVLEVQALHASHEKREQLVGMARDVGGSALEAMPGVGLLMGVLPDEEAQSMTQDRLTRDVEVAVRRQLDRGEQVWLLDDVQLADAETLSLLVELVKRLQFEPPPHPLRLVITEVAQGDESSASQLQETLETLATAVHLEPLSDEELGLFLQSSGVAGAASDGSCTKRQKTWVKARAQRPGDVLSVLRHLEAEGEFEAEESGLKLPDGQRLEALNNVIPTEMLEREEARLERLDPEDLVMLEMAAQCGRRFEAEDLVRGLGESRFSILERLRRVELQEGLLTDVNEHDVFSFELEGTRQALLLRTRRRDDAGDGDGDALPEIAREFHLQVARNLKERRDRGEQVPADRVISHAQQAGPSMKGELGELMVEAAEEAARLFSWERCLDWANRADPLVAGAELRERLSFIRARAQMGIGGQDNRDAARPALRALVDAEHVDARQCLQDWLEVYYVEKEEGDLQALLPEIEALEGRTWDLPWMKETLAFYKVLVRCELPDPPPPREAIESLNNLGSQLAHPQNGEDSETRRYRELLWARIENECANRWQRLDKDDRSAEETAQITAHLEQSIALKKPHGDLAGLAACYGVLGNFHLFVRQDAEAALEQYDEDMKIIEQMGDRNQVPSLLNRQGMGLYKLATAKEPVDQEGVDQALSKATLALEQALKLEQENNALFAAGAVVQYGCEQGKELGTWESALQALENPELFEEGAGFARGGAAGLIRKGAATLEDGDLKTRILATAETLSPEKPPEA